MFLRNRNWWIFHCFSHHSVEFFLSFSFSVFYLVGTAWKRSCVFTMTWEVVWRTNILRTMCICIRKLLVTLENDRNLEWRKKTSSLLCTLCRGGKIMKMKERILKYIQNFCPFENFQLLVKQTTIRLVYMTVIKVAVLSCSFPLCCVGVREEHLFRFSPTCSTTIFKWLQKIVFNATF